MKKYRSKCALASSLDIFGDKWTLLIIRDLFRGCAHFKEFEASPEKIATNILSNRLARLLEHEMVEKYPSEKIPGRDAYRLTEKGRSLGPVLETMAQWGIANIKGTRKFLSEV